MNHKYKSREIYLYVFVINRVIFTFVVPYNLTYFLYRMETWFLLNSLKLG